MKDSMEEMKKNKNLIYPWDLFDKKNPTKFSCSYSHQQLFGLLESRYPEVRKIKPIGRRERGIIRSVVDVMIERYREGEVPWLLAASVSSKFLWMLSEVVPAVMLLTYYLKPLTTSTSELVDLFLESKPVDDFELDPAGEKLYKLSHCGFLVWEDFNERRGEKEKLSASFMGFFKTRAVDRKPTLFLCSSTGSAKEDLKKDIFTNVEATIGSNVPNLLKECAEFRVYEPKHKDVTFGKEKI
jgi:hypothetical protein